MRSQPLVSVLMTAFNRANYIGEAIRSVLSSTFGDFELIVVDDCSSDGTVEIARQYEHTDPRVRVYVNEKNLGDYPNRNKAAGYATGKYLKYLDSDDLIYPHGLGAFAAAMESRPEAAFGLCSRLVQESEPFPILVPPQDSYRRHFFGQGFLDCGPSGVIIRRDVFTNLGGFSGKRMVGDFELWLKIAASYPLLVLPSSLIFWRIHEGQEFAAGMAQGIYMDNLLPLLENAIRSPAAPLTEEEKDKIMRHYRKIVTRSVIRNAVKGKGLGNTGELRKRYGLRLGDFVNATFFMHKGLNG
jgi:glycosyltransferase involved in cell wall biosynthesis